MAAKEEQLYWVFAVTRNGRRRALGAFAGEVAAETFAEMVGHRGTTKVCIAYGTRTGLHLPNIPPFMRPSMKDRSDEQLLQLALALLT
jgi:hypothetical protein